MKLKLNYVAPNSNVVVQTKVDPEMVGYEAWLKSIMQQENAEHWIFFYTVDSTDIWEDDVFSSLAGYLWMHDGTSTLLEPKDVLKVYHEYHPMRLTPAHHPEEKM